LWTSVIGALFVLIDGIAALSTNKLYIWSVSDPVTTGWVEIILGVLMFIAVPFYKNKRSAVGWSMIILALIAFLFDGGFYWIGAILALIGGILFVYKK
jgi:peptidoglycan/LPS O-acetylase OafA/YrhL